MVVMEWAWLAKILYKPITQALVAAGALALLDLLVRRVERAVLREEGDGHR